MLYVWETEEGLVIQKLCQPLLSNLVCDSLRNILLNTYAMTKQL